ncbi:hypothetical protein AAVH_35863 [Aphelenchoides avenae]|nr:hypothetical protein AAVH_35863 [Aphelenchus avenae]
MLVHDTWLESLRFVGRFDLDALDMLNKTTHSSILSDKYLSTVRRDVEDVTFKDGVYSLKGSKDLRCDKTHIAAALRNCCVQSFRIRQAIREEDVSVLYSVALSFSVHMITFYVDLKGVVHSMVVKRRLSCFDSMTCVQFYCAVHKGFINDYFLEMLAAKGVSSLISNRGAAATSALSVDAVLTFLTGAEGRRLFLSEEIDVTRDFIDAIIESAKHALVRKYLFLDLRYTGSLNLDERSFPEATSVEIRRAGVVTYSFHAIKMKLIHEPRSRRLTIHTLFK